MAGDVWIWRERGTLSKNLSVECSKMGCEVYIGIYRTVREVITSGLVM